MSKKVYKLALPSLVVGLVITSLFAAQSHLKTQGDCSNANVGVIVSSNIQRVDCSGEEYGFPLRFLETKPAVDVSTVTNDSRAPLVLGVSSSAEHNYLNLTLNVLLWSMATLIVLLVVHPQSKHHEAQEHHAKKSKK